jgi:hypothetical protein
MAGMNPAISLAAEAAEKIRVLNLVTHPSSGWSGLDDPVDVYEVLGALVTLVDRLQQTTNQLGRFLEYRLHGGHLAVTFGAYLEDPPAAVAAATHALNQARELTAQLAQLISDAQAAVVAVNPSIAAQPRQFHPTGSPPNQTGEATAPATMQPPPSNTATRDSTQTLSDPPTDEPTDTGVY